MPVKQESVPSHAPSLVSMLSGWGQQGVQTLFATQRVLLDLAMRQNASVMHAVRQQLSDPHRSPTAILSEVAEEGMTTFLEGQKVLLELGKQQNEILLEGVKDRVGDCPRRRAMVDMLRRSIDTFIDMHEAYLKMASHQTHSWLESAKAGKPYQPEHVMDLATDAMENFAKAQKRFLDVVAEETAIVTSGKQTNGAGRKLKPKEISELARQAMDSFVEAQKRLVDVGGRQMNAGARTAGKAMDMLKPFPLVPLNELTREAVKSYVDAQKALMEVMVKTANKPKTAVPERGPKRRGRAAKAAAAVA
ncbi:MAG: hypothetical protein WAN03_10950 [Candidatus Sulfotelmatobacter sp.]